MKPLEHAKHPNLLRRWKHYLKKILPPDQHNHMFDEIYNTLNDASYDCIVFDVVEGDDYAVAGANGDDQGRKFRQITLTTSAMPDGPQGGNGPEPIDKPPR